MYKQLAYLDQRGFMGVGWGLLFGEKRISMITKDASTGVDERSDHQSKRTYD